MHDDTITLFRPTGARELELVEESGWRRWPARLPEQPIFYPVANEEYAAEIAAKWNAPEAAGYVTRFEVRRAFMERYDLRRVGGERHVEWWVPAEELEALNDAIVGTIEVIAAYRGAGALHHANRSMPSATVIPVLKYADVREAVAWLCRAFGFRERLRIAEHRAQLTYADGAIVVAAGSEPASGHSVMLRVPHAGSHHARALDSGARIVTPPSDHAYGERQYTAVDPGGHAWTFSETRADVDPASWGGVLVT